MQTRKKQITAFGFLLLIAFPLVVSVGMVIKQKLLHHQRRERFESEVSQTINVSAEKIFWTKPGKEILIYGKSFDVESFKISGNVVILTGFYDHKEDKLVKHMQDIHQQKKDSKRPINCVAIQLLFYPKYKEADNFILQNNWRIVAHEYPVYTEAIHWLNYPAPTPPPKYC